MPLEREEVKDKDEWRLVYNFLVDNENFAYTRSELKDELEIDHFPGALKARSDLRPHVIKSKRVDGDTHYYAEWNSFYKYMAVASGVLIGAFVLAPMLDTIFEWLVRVMSEVPLII